VLSPRIVAALLVLAAGLAGCSRPRRGDFRGTSTPSADHLTYLVVNTDERPGCQVELDGRPWSYPDSTPGPISPGNHAVGCAGDHQPARIVIHDGATFRLALWGP
jgi:hypothetical protein